MKSMASTNKRSKLMSWGANSSGQLGQRRKCEECVQPSEVQLDHLPLVPEDIESIVAGASHSFLLSKTGIVHGCGSNTCRQLADAADGEHEFTVIPCLSNRKITQLATKWNTSYAVTNEKVCLAWGSNSFGQMGHLRQKEINSPQIIATNVKQVAAGLRHVLILNEDGSVSSAGDGKKGQLGRHSSLNFEKVSGLERVVQIACGQNHNFALTEGGKVLGWGCNKFRQLGIEDRDVISEPTVVCEVESTNCKILCGWTHSAILKDGGTLINWGRNKYCQLGEEVSPYRSKPQVLKFNPFNDVEFGSEHCVGLTADGELVCWGWNEHGNCGLGHTADVISPTVVDIGMAVKIGAGAAQSFAIVECT